MCVKTRFNSLQQVIYRRMRNKYVATTEQTFGSGEEQNGMVKINDEIVLSSNLVNSVYCYAFLLSFKVNGHLTFIREY